MYRIRLVVVFVLFCLGPAFADEPTPLVVECPSQSPFSCLADIDIETSTDPDLFFTLGGTVTGGDGSYTATASLYGYSGPLNCPGSSVSYNWAIQDTLGSAGSCRQNYNNVSDGPTISCPADQTIVSSQGIVVDAMDAVATVGCDGLFYKQIISGPQVTGTPGMHHSTYTYDYTVTDYCGRKSTCSQVFTLEVPPPNDVPALNDAVMVILFFLILGTGVLVILRR